MRTIRGRLTVGYAVALAVTMFVFAASLYVLQTPEPAPFAELDARIRVEANLTANVIVDASSSGPVVEVDSISGVETLHSGVASLLQSVADYLLVVGPVGNVLYAATPPVPIRPTDDTIVVTSATFFEELAEFANERAVAEELGVYDAGPPVGELRYMIRRVEAVPGVSTVLSASPTAEVSINPRGLLAGTLVSGPLILIASVLIGYFLAGRTLEPVDRIIDEIEAITDGRSLHRRVAGVAQTEELSRLTSTLNNMLVRLERNFLSLRRFTADASHELKTPLTVLRSGIERTITHPRVPREVLEVLEETLVEVNRMTELVDSLLMLARADEGRAPLHLEPVDIRGLLNEVAETGSILGEQASVTVAVEIPSRSVVMAMDRSRIRQLFMNLLSNAIKYTPRGGHVWIDCRQEGDQVVFRVRDTGIGIAGGQLPHIFDRFWRADVARSRTGERPGVGLGLAICKWIAEAHGGTIRVTSGKGKGTTFTVTLPAGG